MQEECEDEENDASGVVQGDSSSGKKSSKIRKQKYEFQDPPEGFPKPKMQCPRIECQKVQKMSALRYVQREDDGEWKVVAWPHSCTDGISGVYRPVWLEDQIRCGVLSHTTALHIKKMMKPQSPTKLTTTTLQQPTKTKETDHPEKRVALRKSPAEATKERKLNEVERTVEEVVDLSTKTHSSRASHDSSSVNGATDAHQLLLRDKALPNTQDSRGCTALHDTILQGHTNNEEELLGLVRADVHTHNDHGKTPNQLAKKINRNHSVEGLGKVEKKEEEDDVTEEDDDVEEEDDEEEEEDDEEEEEVIEEEEEEVIEEEEEEVIEEGYQPYNPDSSFPPLNAPPPPPPPPPPIPPPCHEESTSPVKSPLPPPIYLGATLRRAFMQGTTPRFFASGADDEVRPAPKTTCYYGDAVHGLLADMVLIPYNTLVSLPSPPTPPTTPFASPLVHRLS